MVGGGGVWLYGDSGDNVSMWFSDSAFFFLKFLFWHVAQQDVISSCSPHSICLAHISSAQQSQKGNCLLHDFIFFDKKSKG